MAIEFYHSFALLSFSFWLLSSKFISLEWCTSGRTRRQVEHRVGWVTLTAVDSIARLSGHKLGISISNILWSSVWWATPGALGAGRSAPKLAKKFSYEELFVSTGEDSHFRGHSTAQRSGISGVLQLLLMANSLRRHTFNLKVPKVMPNSSAFWCTCHSESNCECELTE